MITTLAPWFGSNRTLARHVGEALKGCSFVGVPFAGGMSELAHITARTLAVNDLHRHVINLADVLADDHNGPKLIRRLRRIPFHPAVLDAAQRACQEFEAGLLSPEWGENRIAWAESYFIAAWMARSGTAGTRGEFAGKLAVRWDAGGGDSAVRFRSAVEALREWRAVLRRATFTTLDAFEFLAKCKDEPGHGVYADPPFPGPGRAYRHNCGDTAAEELAWHTRLRDALARFRAAKVVARFYDHPMVRDLYPAAAWDWQFLAGGRTQANTSAPEVLLTNRTGA